MTRLLAATALAGLVALALLGATGRAAAHNSLVSSDPADGARLASGPAAIRLTFDQPVRDGFNTVAVTGPDNTRWATGQVVAGGSSVSAALLPLGPAGEYVIGYRIVSADGHPVTGTVRFQLTRAGSGTPAAQDPAADGDLPAWPFVLAAAVLLGAGVAVGLRLARPAAQ